MFPADLGRFSAAIGQKTLGYADGQHRQKQRHNGDDRLGDAQGVAAHDGGGGADVQDVLGHEGGAVKVTGVVVDDGQQGEHAAGNAGGQAPPPDKGEEDQGQAEGGEGVQRRIQRPLPGHVVGGDAVGQFQLVPGNESGNDSQQEGENGAQPEGLAAYGFTKILHGNFLF